MLRLIYSIAGDSNPLKKELNNVKNHAKSAGAGIGKELGQQMKSALMSYIGAGAVIAALNKQTTEAATIMRDAVKADLGVEAFQELQIASERSGLSIKEIQEIAKELPEDFEAMMKPIRENGGIVPRGAIEDLASLRVELDDMRISAAKLFVTLWGGLKAGAGALLSGIGTEFGAIPGSEKLRETGARLTSSSEKTAERLIGFNESGDERNYAIAFARKAREREQFNSWWESIGGNEDWSTKKGKNATGLSNTEENPQRYDQIVAELKILNATVRDGL